MPLGKLLLLHNPFSKSRKFQNDQIQMEVCNHKAWLVNLEQERKKCIPGFKDPEFFESPCIICLSYMTSSARTSIHVGALKANAISIQIEMSPDLIEKVHSFGMVMVTNICEKNQSSQQKEINPWQIDQHIQTAANCCSRGVSTLYITGRE